MKLATYSDKQNKPRLAAVIVEEGLLVDLQAANTLAGGKTYSGFDSMQAFIEAGDEALDRANELVGAEPRDAALLALNSVQLLPPLPRPLSLRDFLTFEAHVSNALKKGREVGIFSESRGTIPEVWYQAPRFYKCNALNIVGDGTDIVWPEYSERMDFELEIGWVVGKRGRDIKPEDALSHLFGFTIYNDFTARDVLFAEMAARLGPAKGKDFDGSNSLGPWIVTMDEIGDPHDLEMTARINGKEVSRGNSGQAYHKIEDCIAYVSRCETIHPGEILGSGTVGTGSGIEHDLWLQDGDTIELTIDKIGTLTNRVHGPSARPYAETRETNIQINQ